jgi:putative oxidoreductase
LSIDNLLGGESNLGRTVSRWEPWGPAIARVILAFLFTLHGYRQVFGIIPKSAGRAAVVPLAIDKLPALVGWWEIAGGLLLLVGLFTRISATITCMELAAAYLLESIPRGAWPLRNGGNEALVYLVFFLFLAVCGAGAFSLDSMRSKRPVERSTVDAAVGSD